MSDKPARRHSGTSFLKRFYQDFSSKELLILAIFIAIFFGASAFSGIFSDKLRHLFAGESSWGLWLYAGLVFVTELILPGSSLPLVPIMAQLRGQTPTALATIVGWMGSVVIAFAVARRFRGRLLQRAFSEETLEKIGQTIPRQHLFWSNVLFRMVFPVGPASYAIALFTRMGWVEYIAASMTGLVPYAFMLVWISTWPRTERLIADAVGILLTAVVYGWLRMRVVGQLRRNPQP
jgi:uncharacterized membrane protein YdjX (TVP38/TMEM64 family)